MYKVFLNEQLIVLTQKCALELMDNEMVYLQYDDFEELHFVITLLESQSELAGVVIQSNDLEELWADFRAHFREIDAAGGLVTNGEGELLLIYRFGKWDLPKGKREQGEEIAQCALREVEEECGVQELRLGKPLDDTYHIYHQKGIRYLKRTYWFDMHAAKTSLTPQLEEGILEAKWFKPEHIHWEQMPTYPNIRLLVDAQRGAS